MRYLTYNHKLMEYVRVNEHSSTQPEDIIENHRKYYFRSMTNEQIDEFIRQNAIIKIKD